MTEDPQKTWSDYYQRKKDQRKDEAFQMCEQMQRAGVNDETYLALDFVFFGTSKPDVENLAKQLSENYEMQIIQNAEEGNWLVKGTTRPYGITLSKEQHIGWVEFMSDVAQSYACVFSTWALEAPKLGAHFNSENIESAS
ncbi:MAG: hypothetical protein U5M53_09795 [Rhodoferax sp.]|nr:hypothetical protein [Rhodoferax sp.]